MSVVLAQAPPANPAQNLREVRRGVAQAGDAQVLQVLRMVDALEERGATDAVLDQVRPRLRAIKPARPLRFARLLFMPLDPLIVVPKAWRAGTPFLPRTALMVLARAVRLMMADDTAQIGSLARIDAMIEGANTDDAAIVRQAGSLLWPCAADRLGRLGAAPEPDRLAACSAEWAAEGLSRTELQPLALALAHILAHAQALHDHDHAGARIEEPALLDMLAGSQSAGARACGMMLSLLVLRLPEAAPALLGAAQAAAGLRPLAEAAVETALAWLEAETADQRTTIVNVATIELGRQTALLNALADQPGATRRRRVAEVKGQLLTGCLHRLEASLQERVMAPLRTLPANPEQRDVALDALEDTARTLRRFEVEARRLGASAKFDAMAQDACAAVVGASCLSRMDRARLVEILAGPAAALALLA